jgi:hypothetical protein
VRPLPRSIPGLSELSAQAAAAVSAASAGWLHQSRTARCLEDLVYAEESRSNVDHPER